MKADSLQLKRLMHYSYFSAVNILQYGDDAINKRE